MRILEERQEEIVKLYTNGESKISISRRFFMDSRTVTNILKTYNVYQRNQKESCLNYNKEEEGAMTDRFLKGEKMADIVKDFRISRNTLTKIFKNKNIKTRRRKDYCNFNKNYFDVIDTEAKAYFLGLLYADGYNAQRKQAGYVVIILQYRDKHILDKLCLEVEHKVGVTITSCGYGSVRMCSCHFSERCAELGCFQKKSLTLKFPTSEQLPHHLMNHFIRGYFDGDGCISASGTPTMTIVSSDKFCEGLNEELSKIVGLKNLKNHNPKSNNITKSYRFGGKRQIRKFYDYIYKDATVYLTRKKDKFISILNLEQ